MQKRKELRNGKDGLDFESFEEFIGVDEDEL
jgi:hypothetical protein